MPLPPIVRGTSLEAVTGRLLTATVAWVRGGPVRPCVPDLGVGVTGGASGSPDAAGAVVAVVEGVGGEYGVVARGSSHGTGSWVGDPGTMQTMVEPMVTGCGVVSTGPVVVVVTSQARVAVQPVLTRVPSLRRPVT